MSETLLLLVLLLVLPLLVAGWFLQARAMERRLSRLERQAASLSQRFFALSLWSEALERRLQGEPWPAPFRLPAAASPTDPATHATADAATHATANTAATSAPEPPRLPARAPGQVRAEPAAQAPPAGEGRRWKRIERGLVANGSGLLGVLVVVAGVTFLAINAGLELDARQRSLLTLLAGGLLAAPSLLWGRRERWRDLTAGMRSGGGALVLFACAAAGGLPQFALQWIDAPAPALALLAAGVAVNLGLAAIARNAATASLHVAVSLVPLAIGPQGAAPLIIATAIALLGAELPLRHPWLRHRLLVCWLSGAFQLVWFLRNQPALAASPALVAAAVLAALLVFGGGLLRLHRQGVAPPRLQALPLALLVSLWSGLGLALLLYPPQPAARAAALAFGAVLALLLAQRARRAGSLWLAMADRLAAQALVLASLLSLAPLIADGPLLIGAVLLECLSFQTIAARQDEPALARIGWWLSAAAALLLALSGLPVALLSADPQGQLQSAAVLSAAAALLAGAQAPLARRSLLMPLPPLPGWIAGALIFVATVLVVPQEWRSFLSLVVMGAFLVAARRWRPPGLLSGVSAAIVAAHGVLWLSLLARQPWPLATLLPGLLPLVGLALLLLGSAGGGRLQALGLALLGLDAGLGALLLLDPVSPLLPGAAWLLLAAAALAGSRWWRGELVRVGLGLTLVYLGGFGAAYLLVIGPSQDLLTLGALELRGRWLIELLALAVCLHGWFFRAGPELARLRAWQRLQPCYLEGAVLAVALTVQGSIGTVWRPAAWALLALVLLCPPLVRRFAPRLPLYGVIVYWLSVAALVGTVVVRPAYFPSLLPFGGGAGPAAGLAAIALQTGFVVVSQRWLDRQTLERCEGLPLLGWISRRLVRQRNRWLFYPLFVAVAFVLAAGYDHALLTLLWTAEAIAIYLLGVALREPPFRQLAVIGLGACLLRLLAVDMARADLGLRGLVFIGVGLLLLALNAIARRFENRFR